MNKGNKDRIDGGWKQLKANARRQRGNTYEDYADTFEHKRGHVAKVLDIHGVAEDEVKTMLTDWPRRFKDKRKLKKDH